MAWTRISTILKICGNQKRRPWRSNVL
ncbi:hypothetical protein [Planktotalea sp.]